MFELSGQRRRDHSSKADSDDRIRPLIGKDIQQVVRVSVRQLADVADGALTATKAKCLYGEYRLAGSQRPGDRDERRRNSSGAVHQHNGGTGAFRLQTDGGRHV
jgi:hypothetical protein